MNMMWLVLQTFLHEGETVIGICDSVEEAERIAKEATTKTCNYYHNFQPVDPAWDVSGYQLPDNVKILYASGYDLALTEQHIQNQEIRTYLSIKPMKLNTLFGK